MSYLKELGATDSHGAKSPDARNSTAPHGGKTPPVYGGANVGDLIQWEADGVLCLPNAARVRAVRPHEGKEWVFVEGSETGIPMEQVIVEQKGQEGSKVTNPPTLPLESDSQRLGTRKEVFALDEGDVVLTFPENLSAASFYDLEGHLGLFLRKAQRRAGAGSYFAEVYAPDGVKAKEVRYFDQFAPLAEFAKQFKTQNSRDILRVHLPARAPDEERRAVNDLGAQLIF